jgi:hypothetical protein
MAKKQSDKNRYPSQYSPGGFVRCDQYIIETICRKKAQTQKKDLPVQFWKNPEWAKFFKSQLRKCKSLLQTYSAEAIIKALEDKRSWNIYSLFAPWLEDIIKEYQVQIDKPKIHEDLPEINGTKFDRKPQQDKKSIINLLEDLE